MTETQKPDVPGGESAEPVNSQPEQSPVSPPEMVEGDGGGGGDGDGVAGDGDRPEAQAPNTAPAAVPEKTLETASGPAPEVAKAPETAPEKTPAVAKAPAMARVPAAGKPGKRRRWLRLAVLIGIALLLLFVLTWKNCRQGIGLGGSPAPRNERQNDPANAMAPDAPSMAVPSMEAQAPCQIRVDAVGILVNGKTAATPQAAVAACAPSRRAVILVTGDAVYGQVEQLEQALRGAQIEIQRQQ